MEEEGGGVSSAATSNVNEGHADAVVVELMEIVDAKPSGGEEGQDITGEAVAAAVEDTINADPQQQQQQQEVHVKKVKKTKFRKSADTIEGGVVTGGPSGLATRKIKKVSGQIIFPHSCSGTTTYSPLSTLYALGFFRSGWEIRK